MGSQAHDEAVVESRVDVRVGALVESLEEARVKMEQMKKTLNDQRNFMPSSE